MSLLLCNAAACAVALLYCAWKTRQALAARREAVLRRRVAYMLWVIADASDRRSGEWRLTARTS